MTLQQVVGRRAMSLVRRSADAPGGENAGSAQAGRGAPSRTDAGHRQTVCIASHRRSRLSGGRRSNPAGDSTEAGPRRTGMCARAGASCSVACRLPGSSPSVVADNMARMRRRGLIPAARSKTPAPGAHPWKNRRFRTWEAIRRLKPFSRSFRGACDLAHGGPRQA
jgi:hypothetical protein